MMLARWVVSRAVARRVVASSPPVPYIAWLSDFILFYFILFLYFYISISLLYLYAFLHLRFFVLVPG